MLYIISLYLSSFKNGTASKLKRKRKKNSLSLRAFSVLNRNPNHALNLYETLRICSQLYIFNATRIFN